MNENNYNEINKVEKNLNEIALKFDQIAGIDGGKLIACLVNELNDELGSLHYWIGRIKEQKED